MSEPWIGEPDPEGSGVQVHQVYQGGSHPCCNCEACESHWAFINDEESLNNALRQLAKVRDSINDSEPPSNFLL